MKLTIVALVAVAQAAHAAHADPATRCAQGVSFARHGDLPRAALYLDGCDDAQLDATLADEVARAQRDVRKRIDASALSELQVLSKPEGMTASIDALPGETFVTPATVWVRAGHHEVHAARDAASLAGKAIVNSVDVPAHAHATIVLDAGTPKLAPPTAGRVDFGEEGAAEAPTTGPPPEQKHGTLMPCKFAGTCPAQGEHIDDPLAVVAAPPPPHPTVSYELRAGVVADGAGAGPSLAIAVVRKLPWQDPAAVHPWLWQVHGGYLRRRYGNTFEDAGEVGKVLAAPDSAWLSLGAGIGYGFDIGLEGTASLDLALRNLPIAIGARFEQGFESRESSVILELGVGWRRY
ncbi:MAG TPA: hypothetical protein VLX92_22265 [Kofleriaceae bacterium]|nr:hypothetical protein [Kofleriaceae bacterium]